LTKAIAACRYRDRLSLPLNGRSPCITFIDEHPRCNVKATGAPNAGREQGAVLRQVPRRRFFPTRYLLVAAMLALGGRATATAQMVTEYPLPTAGSEPFGIAAGPDGALWFTEYATAANTGNTTGGSKVGRITTAGVISEYPLANPLSTPQGIAPGPDGALWFTEAGSATIGWISTAGTITEFPVSLASGTSPAFGAITVGSDGALWFTAGSTTSPPNGLQGGTAVIGRITTDGAISLFTIPGDGIPVGIGAGPDGALWIPGTRFGEVHGGVVGRLTTSGASAVFGGGLDGSGGITAGPDGALWFGASPWLGRITTAGMSTNFGNVQISSDPNAIAAGPDGALWFFQAEPVTNGSSYEVIGRMTTGGTNTQFPTPTTGNYFESIVAGPDGAMWFTEFGTGKIGRITVPASTSPLVAAVLPSSRSVEIGSPTTAFATIINGGATNATGCAIQPVTPVPAAFQYQTTDPTTNQVTGALNSPVNIAAGGSQSFVFGLMTNAPFVPTLLQFGFDCAGTDAAQSVPALNTLLLSASATPVPDIIATVATASNDGILDIAGTAGSAAMAVATADVGAGGTITATANTGSATLPLALTLCQTDPTSSACLNPPATSVTTMIAANATPTFGVFGTASGSIAFNPANSRIFVQFTDSGGTIRGETSVAVRTQ
jgi:streptogramin lyase